MDNQKENFEFKPIVLLLKMDLVSHPFHSKGIGWIYYNSIFIVKANLIEKGIQKRKDMYV